VALALLALAWGLDRVLPAPAWPPAPWRWLGAAPCVAGAALAGTALGLFRRAGTTHHPFGDASALVTTGPYRLTRNPMYVGVVLLLLGVALLAASPWMLGAPVLFVLWIDRLQIPREEEFLATRFGGAYADYRRRVRRWL
jgi:protein-S-isoprenylcysteine O-methyltransferase Ste14